MCSSKHPDAPIENRPNQNTDALPFVRLPPDFVPAVVSHPPLEDAPLATHMVFAGLFEAAHKELWKRLGADPSRVNEHSRQELFAPAETARILPDQVMDSLISGDAHERTHALDQAVQAYRRHLLGGVSFLGRGGRKQENTERGNRVYEMRKKGMPYGQIQKKLLSEGTRISRGGIQAEYRREAKLRKRLYEGYLELKATVSPWFTFVESPPSTETIVKK